MRPVRPVLALAAIAVLAGTVTVAQSGPAAPRLYDAAIEDYSPYQGQTACTPGAKPGTAALRALVLRTYAGSGDLGISRNCRAGGRSEHKEGRAWDWKVNAASAVDRGRVDDMLTWLFATDVYGNAHANFRRLGLMYVIWNRQIWTSESRHWEPYFGASPHTDHVHFSLNRAGGAGQTSFWDGTPTEVERPPGIVQERLVVRAASPKGATTRREVKAGVRYRVTVAGTYSPRPGVTADAQCRTGAGGWGRADSVGDVRLNWGSVAMTAVNPTGGTGCDLSRHTYVYEFVSGSSRRLNASLVTDGRFSDNRGALSVLVSELPPVAQPASPCAVVPDPARPVAVPAAPTIDGPSTRLTPYGCTALVSGTSLQVAPVVLQRTDATGTGVAGTAVPDLTGRWSVGLALTRDTRYYAAAVSGRSADVDRFVLPVVSRPHQRFPLRNTPVRVTGRSAPGLVVVRYRVAGDPAGTYPRIASTRADAAGRWGLSLPANRTYAYRVGRDAAGPFGAVHVKEPR